MQEYKRFQFVVGQRLLCSGAHVYGFADVHVVVLTTVKLKVIYLKILIFKAKINTTHVALNALRPEVEEMQQIFVLQDIGYNVRHCKENATIYMYALLRSTRNAYDVTSYHRLSRPRAPIFWTSLRHCREGQPSGPSRRPSNSS